MPELKTIYMPNLTTVHLINNVEEIRFEKSSINTVNFSIASDAFISIQKLKHGYLILLHRTNLQGYGCEWMFNLNYDCKSL